MAEADSWLYTDRGARKGPVTRSVLVSMLVSGKLAPTTLVWREGMEAWQPASALADLAPSIPPPLPEDAQSRKPSSVATPWTWKQTAQVGVTVAWWFLLAFAGARGDLATALGAVTGMAVYPSLIAFAVAGRKRNWRGFARWLFWIGLFLPLIAAAGRR